MKKVTGLVLFSLLIIGFNTPLFAQQGFDVKKHKKQNLNTSSLNAGRTNGAKSAAAGRGVAANTIVKNSRPMLKPSLGQPGVKVHYSSETGLPLFITSPRSNSSIGRTGAGRDSRVATFDYLTELKDVLQVENPNEVFAIRNVTIDKKNKTHVRMEQFYHGIPVYGAEVVVHLNASGEGESFNGKYLKIADNDKISLAPTVSNQVAVQRVTSNLQQRTRVHALSDYEKKFVQYGEPDVKLCIYQDKGLVKTNVLAYHIIYYPSVLERWEYFVDATTGAVLHQFESTCGVDGPRTASGPDLNGVTRAINTYQVGTSYVLLDVSRTMFNPTRSTLPSDPIGGIVTVDVNGTFGKATTIQYVSSTNNTWASNPTQTRALSAHFNAGVAYEYFRSKHLRNSIDGDNGSIISLVNVLDDDGKPLDNAFWNGAVMSYGNGDVDFKPLSGGLDVSGHEMTHGVVQNTANLEYQGESGAINESMADVFGVMMDPTDWKIGEDIVKLSSFPTGAMRDMSNPHNGGTSLATQGYQPEHTSEKYTGTQDNGGVHINSGIPNRAFYLFATAAGMTLTKAADVYYKALSEYLTKSSQFIDLRLAVIKATTDLYGAGSSEVTAAGTAFTTVGIADGQGGDYNPTLPSNPGSEFILLYNTQVGNPNTLYRGAVDNAGHFSDLTPLTTTEFLSRPSVTDQGDVAVFVAGDHTIHVIKVQPGSDPVENVLQDQEMWSNVVVSKGGSKLAAVSTDQDATIWVYDFLTEEWNQFALYNPTYTEGVTSAGPVYADALEWDYAGEFLVYDCFNQLDNADPTATPIEYWDVNFIHVWDNTAKTFADGTIEKLFSSLPEGISIGNPSFAKNSPNVIAFDFVDETTDEYFVVGCNIETSDLNALAENQTIGWPSYNKNDTRVAFTTQGTVEAYDASFVALNADKISAATTSSVMQAGAKWPVYFASGSRDTGDDVVTGIPSEVNQETLISCYPNSLQREVTVQTGDPGLLSGNVEVVNTIGQRVYFEPAQPRDEKHFVVNLEHLKAGQYFMRISGAHRSAGCKLYKQ